MLFDTGALITLAVDVNLWNLAVTRFQGRGRVPLAVTNELTHLRGRSDMGVAQLAEAALTDLDWLGEPLTVDDDRRSEVERLRDLIAGGRPLTHPLQHYGEAALIVIGQPMGAEALIEDYDARIAAHDRHVPPISVHRLLHLWIKAEVLTAQQAVSYANAISDAGRGPSYTAEELETGGRALGRVWEP